MVPLRTLLLSLGALVVAAGAVALVLDPSSNGSSGNRQKPRYFRQGAVVALSILRPKSAIEIQKRKARWEIVRPRKLPANRRAVERMLRRCARLEPVRKIGRVPNLAQYGLEPPLQQIRIRLTGGSEFAVELGQEDGFGGGVFARIGGSSEVVVLAPETALGLDRTLLQVRDHRLIREPLTHADGIEIRQGKRRILLERRAHGWALDGIAPADPLAVRGFLALLGDVRARRYLVDGTSWDPKTYGLDQPDAQVAVEVAGDPIVLSLRRQPRGGFVAAVAGQDIVARVSRVLWRAVSRERDAWRSRYALRFRRSRVGSIRIARQGHLVLLSKEAGNRWELLAPRPGPAKASVVRRLLRGLARLWASRPDERPTAPQLRRLQLTPPLLEVRVEDRRGIPLDGLRIGAIRQDERAAQSLFWPPLFWLDKGAVDRLPLHAKDYTPGSAPAKRTP